MNAVVGAVGTGNMRVEKDTLAPRERGPAHRGTNRQQHETRHDSNDKYHHLRPFARTSIINHPLVRSFVSLCHRPEGRASLCAAHPSTSCRD